MKKYFLTIFLIFSSAYSQYDINGGMGLNFFSAPDLRDYINANFATTDELQSFNTSADFFGEFGYNFNDSYQLSIEYTQNLYSFNSNGIGGIYDLKLTQHKPSIIGYYLITGVGYKFKFGGGLGIRFVTAQEKIPGLTQVLEYSTSGFGILLKTQGDTKLGGDFYALISGELRYEILGDLDFSSGNTVNLNSFGVALKLGLAYYF